MKKNGFLYRWRGFVQGAFALWFIGFVITGYAANETVVWNVRVGKAKLASIPQYISALGSLTAMKAVAISPVVDGKISQINFSNGQMLVEGDVIAQLDSQQAQAQVNYDNYYSDLRSSGYSDEIDWDTFQGISDEAYSLSYSNDYFPGAPEAKRIGFFDVIGDLIESMELSDIERIDRGIDEMDSLIQSTAILIADIGSRINIADAQIRIMEETKIRYKNLISSAEDLDYSTAVTELSSEMLALEAAQSSFARISQLSLFDYIR